jgi:hypothetical protein
MAHKTLIVTASDRRYFPLAESCLRSIQDNPNRADCSIAFLDLGCDASQAAWVRQVSDHVEVPDWEFDFPERDSKPGFLRGLLARPFLRKYFPGYDVYLWIDADAWVQNWYAVELLVRAAYLRTGLAIVPEVDRCSLRQYGGLPAYWEHTFGWYRKAFGEAIAQRLFSFPMLNAGVYAMHRDAPHWEIWKDSIAHALHQVCSTMTDQVALNCSVYLSGLLSRTELLPAWCNWTCHNGFPKWDSKATVLVENYLPNHPIGILHLTTRDKSVIRNLESIDGTNVAVQLTYPAKVIQ